MLYHWNMNTFIRMPKIDLMKVVKAMRKSSILKIKTNLLSRNHINLIPDNEIIVSDTQFYNVIWCIIPGNQVKLWKSRNLYFMFGFLNLIFLEFSHIFKKLCPPSRKHQSFHKDIWWLTSNKRSRAKYLYKKNLHMGNIKYFNMSG